MVMTVGKNSLPSYSLEVFSWFSGPGEGDSSKPAPTADGDDEDQSDREVTEGQIYLRSPPEVDSRRTAEALMKLFFPGHYQALVDAGEVDE